MSGVHKKTFIHLLSYFLFFVSLINCEKGTSPNNSQEVNLAVKYIGITEVEIELQTKKIEADTEFRLFREDSLINHGILIQPNTVITDSQLLPAQEVF